jgi:hypothetical protein
MVCLLGTTLGAYRPARFLQVARYLPHDRPPFSNTSPARLGSRLSCASWQQPATPHVRHTSCPGLLSDICLSKRFRTCLRVSCLVFMAAPMPDIAPAGGR